MNNFLEKTKVLYLDTKEKILEKEINEQVEKVIPLLTQKYKDVFSEYGLKNIVINDKSLCSDICEYLKDNNDRSEVYNIIKNFYDSRIENYDRNGELIAKINENLLKRHKEMISKLYDLKNEVYNEILDQLSLNKKDVEVLINQEKNEIEIKNEKCENVDISINHTNEEKTDKEKILEELVIKSKNVINELQKTYYELKEDELKYVLLAEKLKLDYQIIKVDDMDMLNSIKEIEFNVENMKTQLLFSNDYQKELLEDTIKNFDFDINSKELIDVHKDELEKIFIKSLESKVEELIKDSKLNQLNSEEKELENKKISIFGIFCGDLKLKKAKIENIQLQKEKILRIVENEEKVVYNIEDIISDLYAYKESNSNLSDNTIKFIKDIEEEMHFQIMLDKSKLEKLVVEKVKNRTDNSNLLPVLISDNKHSSRKEQINIIYKNNQMLKELIGQSEEDSFNKLLMPKRKNVNIASLMRYKSIINLLKIKTSDEVEIK